MYYHSYSRREAIPSRLIVSLMSALVFKNCGHRDGLCSCTLRALGLFPLSSDSHNLEPSFSTTDLHSDLESNKVMDSECTLCLEGTHDSFGTMALSTTTTITTTTVS